MPEATIFVDASADVVRRILLTPLDLPRWNPAFLSIDGPAQPRVGEAYRITVRPGLPGTFCYDGISPERLDARWRVLGSEEHGSWLLTPLGRGVQVRHEFTHRGLLASLMRRAFAAVAEHRVQRLKEVAEITSRTGTLPWRR